MSMLAGPRRKQKVINLRAKNNAWSNDNNKFGQRMLEKMGWSDGKGLGLKENGMVDHVIAKFKNDDKGLGYEDKNDQWTKHEDEFNSLLANLSNGDANDSKLHSGISLEDKSKKSKARVHYHKFTRGKDLTRYSEKDLANIFGKKSLKTNDKNETSANQDLKCTTEQVFTEKGSMTDYFKNKLATMKSKSVIQMLNDNENEGGPDYTFRGFTGTGVVDSKEAEAHQGFGFSILPSNKQTMDYTYSEIKSSSTDVKSKLKMKCESENSQKQFSNLSYNTPKIELDKETDVNEVCHKKKKKKIKDEELRTLKSDSIKNNLFFSAEPEHCTSNNESTKIRKKKSKSNKGVSCEQTTPISEKMDYDHIETSIPFGDTQVKKVKKVKNKNKQLQEEEHQKDMLNNIEEQEDCYVPKKKKKRKNKEF